jgi:UDP-hydrolysing UDP-N-acetyl-D-glucosamine 2-epimerase
LERNRAADRMGGAAQPVTTEWSELMPRKIAVVVTARPSYARIKTVLQAVQEHPDLELQLVVAASALLDRYGNVVEVIRADGFTPAMEVHMVVEGETPLTSTKTVGLGIVEMSNVFHHLKPDAVLSVADRYETITTAISAAYMNIPVAHVQGGEVTGSIDEKVRHSVTKLADLHFVASKNAASRVMKMGEWPERVFITGCPSVDLAAQVRRHNNSPELKASVEHHVSRGVGEPIDPHGDYVICMQHPVTYEWLDAASQVRETLMAIHESGVPCYWFWPNVDAGSDLTSRAIRTFREHNEVKNIHFLKNMPPEPFLYLLSKAKCIVGNSSAGIREASYLGVPAINIGSRQAGRDCGRNVIHVPHSQHDISDALERQFSNGPYESDPLYGDGNAGPRIAQLLAMEELSTEKKLAY